MDPNPKDRVSKGKVPLGLFPPTALIITAMALRDGAVKYGPYNWRDIPIQYSEYINAMLRHLMAIMDGEDIADDSGIDHLGHIIATAAILIDARCAGTLVDDRRMRPGGAPKLLKEMHELIVKRTA
jgi:Domain of unknown function (DUF5664)